MKRFKSISCLQAFREIKIRVSFTAKNLYFFKIENVTDFGFFFNTENKWHFFYKKSIYHFDSLSKLFEFITKHLGGI